MPCEPHDEEACLTREIVPVASLGVRHAFRRRSPWSASAVHEDPQESSSSSSYTLSLSFNERLFSAEILAAICESKSAAPYHCLKSKHRSTYPLMSACLACNNVYFVFASTASAPDHRDDAASGKPEPLSGCCRVKPFVTPASSFLRHPLVLVCRDSLASRR